MTVKRISNADIRRAWLDGSITTAQAAASVGLHRVNLWRRAKALGLPRRRNGGPPVLFAGPEFVAMWCAGVGIADIAAHFGGRPTGVKDAARRLGLSRRPAPHRPIPLAQYRARCAEEALAARMAAAARQERQALRLADMVDGPRCKAGSPDAYARAA